MTKKAENAYTNYDTTLRYFKVPAIVRDKQQS